MKNKLIVLIAVVGFSVSALAGAYGPKEKKFGAGIVLGDPTGFTLKGYVAPKLAIDGFVSWSFVEEAFVLIGDVIYEFAEIPVETRKITLPFYAGAGAKIGVDQGGKNNNRTVAGLRIPVGIAVQFVQYPIEIFLEVAPGMEVAPSTAVDVTGGLGGRYYFF